MAATVSLIWRVVGGGEAKGIVVREQPSLSSEACGRLATGALVQEQSLVGERMHYQLVAGSGPSRGWVSIKTKDKDLLVRTTTGPVRSDLSLLANGGPIDKATHEMVHEGTDEAAEEDSRDAGIEERFASVGCRVDDLQKQIQRLADFSARLCQELSDLHADHSALRQNHMALCCCMYGRNILQPDQLGVVLSSEKRVRRMSSRLNSVLVVMDDEHLMEAVRELAGQHDPGIVHFAAASRAFGRLRTSVSTTAQSDANGYQEERQHHRLDETLWSRLKKFEPTELVLKEWGRSQTVQAVLGSQGVEGTVGKTEYLNFKDVYSVFDSIGLSLDQFVNKFRHMPCKCCESTDANDVRAAADRVLRRFAGDCAGKLIKCRDVYRLLEILGCSLKRFKETFPTAAAVVDNPGEGQLVQIGSYRIRRVIGQGFKGVRCYLAEHSGNSSWVAIKWPAPRDEVAVVKEIQAKAPKDCLGLPQIMNFGSHLGHSYIVSELLGSPLTKVLNRIQERATETKWRALRIIGRLLVRRLEAFHGCGYVHCDISPENVLLGRGRLAGAGSDSRLNASLYLIDFELAQKHPGGPKLESHIGSAEWSSIRSADNVERLPEDDLEALGWVLANGLLGPLPWFNWLEVAYRDWESKWTRDQTVRQVQRAKMHFLQKDWKALSWTVPAKVPDSLVTFIQTCSATVPSGSKPDYLKLIEILGGNPAQGVEAAEEEDLKQFSFHVTPLLSM